MPAHRLFADTALGARVERGVFREHMAVELVNDGPVTLVIDSGDLGEVRR